MLLRIFLYLLILFAPLISYSQKVEGYVHDKAGNPLAFATIIVENTPYGITTNKSGYYSLTLPEGNYVVTCRYIGFKTESQNADITSGDAELNFTLSLQQLEMDEIIITTSGEDPAYPIIRGAIKKRPFYNNQVKSYVVDAYIKGMVRLLQMPEAIKNRIRSKDVEKMALDSAGQGIIYLAESFTRVSVREPDQRKMEVLSNRVSGQEGFGYDFPVFLNFYSNTVDVSYGMEKNRGFVSPISDNALFYYKYKLLGTFKEKGVKVYSIDVSPRRKFEPLFSGTINITDEDYRIFSTDLLLTKESQLQFFDTLSINQLHTRQTKDIWRLKNQVVKFHLKQLGIAAEGDFVNVYNNYILNPKFPKGYFGRTIIKYDTSSNKKSIDYWDTLRPIPLEADELIDYVRKDSIQKRMDSLNMYNRLAGIRPSAPVKMRDLLFSDLHRNIYARHHTTSVGIQGLLNGLRYNMVEGVSLNPSVKFTRPFWKPGKQVHFLADVRYGFHDRQLNPWGGFVVNELNTKNSRPKNYKIYFAGGNRLSQFDKLSPLPTALSAISTLFWGNNYEKLYENYFFKAGYSNSWNKTIGFSADALYEDRRPVENTTDFIFFKSRKDHLTPNYPAGLLISQFSPHKAVILHAGMWIRPGQRFIQYPDEKVSLGSKAPAFYFDYYKGVPDVFNSSENFDRWEIDVRHRLNLKLKGKLDYSLGIGGFLNRKEVNVQDYKHFYGNPFNITTRYLKDFQGAGVYDLSTATRFYTELHLEHHSEGMLTNKIPVFRKLNWNLVEGINYLYAAPGSNHLEVYAGLMNIFKIFRVDAVMTMRNGLGPAYTYKVGLEGLLGNSMRNIFFRKREKIINSW